jgi:HlyD family secretion protein
MKRRLILAGVIVVIVVAILILILSESGKKSESIRTSGTVEGVEVNISATVAGRILKECCKEGDAVRECDIVIELESDELRASVEQALAGVEKAKAEVQVSESAIESARANLKSAEAEIGNAEAEVETARAEMEEARREVDRLDALFQKGFVPKASLDVAATNHETAVAKFVASKARLAAAYSKRDAVAAQLNTVESQSSSAKAAFKEAEANLSYSRARFAETTIKSPIKGTVVFKSLEKGETVSPGVTILTIVDLDDLYVRVDIEETMIDGVSLNGQALIRTEEDPDGVFQGKISEIGSYAEFATQRDVARGRQDIKTFRVKIAVPDSKGFLKPGMTVEVEIPKRTPNE